MTRSRPRAGKTRLGCLLFVLLLSVVGYYGWPAAHAAANFYQFQDAMDQQARFANKTPDETIVANLRATADSLGLPDEAQRIQVHRKTNKVWIWATYTEAIELPGYEYLWERTAHSEKTF